MVMVAAVAALALMAGGAGFWMWHQSNSQLDTVSSSNPTTGVTPSVSAQATAAAVVAPPLTAQLDGEYCPVAHVGNSACWKGTVLNTGPTIGNLAIIFIVGSPYSDWFATHANGTLSGFYTSSSCEIDAPHSRIVCGPVSPGQEIDVYLGGDVTKRGTFNYAVKFADISGASTNYINQHPDGTHDIVSWRESIT